MNATRSTRLASTLQAALNIQPGEGARVGLMILYSAAAIGGVRTVGVALANGLFLSGLPASATPFVFILPAIAIVLTLLLYNWCTARFLFDHVVVASSAVLLSVALLFRLLLDTSYGARFVVLAPLYLFAETSATLVILQFWTVAGQIFDAREARRLFGLIAVGGTLSNVVAGLALGLLARSIGVANLLFVVAIALGMCGACAWYLGRMRGDRNLSRPALAPTSSDLRQDVRAIRRAPLLMAMAGLVVLLALLINIGAYQFYLVLQLTFAGQDEAIVVFLGAYEFWTGLAALVVQLILTGRVLSRAGVLAALLFFPLAMAFGAAAVLLTGGALWTFVLVRGADPVFRRTINDAALNILYLPAPAVVRQRAKQLLEIVYALTFGLLGIAFLAMRAVPGWTYLDWSFPLLILASVWIASLVWVRRQYVRALAQSVGQRRLDLEAATLDVTDETTVQVLARALHDPDDVQVVHALQLIARAPNASWDAHIAPLLAHPAPEVRILALQHLGRAGNLAYAEPVAALFQAEDDVRAAAIEAFCAIVGHDAITRVAPFLADSNPHVKGAAVAGLIRDGGLDGVLHAAADLKGMLESHDPAMRQEGAHVLGLLQVQTFYGPLVVLLDDTDAAVRLSAIHAAGKLRSPQLIPHLVRKLSDSATAPAATEALIGYGTASLPELSAILSNSAEDCDLRAQIARILQHIGAQPVVDILLVHLCEPDERVRTAIVRALARLCLGGAPISAAPATLHKAIMAELRNYYALYALQADLSAQGDDLLLNDALQVRMGRARDRVFWLLGILYPDQQVERAHQALELEHGGARALAIELLDNLAERQIKELLIPLIEAPAETVLEIAHERLAIPRRSPVERLVELAGSPDPWLRACAIFRIGAQGDSSLAELAIAALESDNALVREAAVLTCGHLFAQKRFASVTVGQATGGRPGAGRHYAVEPEHWRPHDSFDD